MILKVIPQWFLSDSSGDPPRPPRCILPIASSLLIIITTCHQVIHYFYRVKNQRKIPFKILQSFSNMSPQNIISKKKSHCQASLSTGPPGALQHLQPLLDLFAWPPCHTIHPKSAGETCIATNIFVSFHFHFHYLTYSLGTIHPKPAGEL